MPTDKYKLVYLIVSLEYSENCHLLKLTLYQHLNSSKLLQSMQLRSLMIAFNCGFFIPQYTKNSKKEELSVSKYSWESLLLSKNSWKNPFFINL